MIDNACQPAMSSPAPDEATPLDAAAEMRRIRNRVRQRQAQDLLVRRSASGTPLALARLRRNLHLARQARQVKELPFTSPTPVIGPLIAGFRTLWNNVACKWHVRRILAQQNNYNLLVYELLFELADQVEALQATVAEQAALLLDLETRVADEDGAPGRTPLGRPQSADEE
jgi:hypothetical protein